jgi:DNA-binding SARP family transcriptional activator
MPLEFRVLGSVGAWAGDLRVGLGRPESAKVRCVLAVLLRTPGDLVTTDALVERVWGYEPPGSAVRYKYIGWLRSALAPYGVTLAHRDEGYVLQADVEQVDLHRFRHLVAAARRARGADRVGEARRLLDQALGLWQGPALSGLPGAWAAMFRDQLGREQRDARVLAARLALSAGRFAEAAERLAGWEAEYPTDEEIVALHMTALERCGRRSQALLVYAAARRRLQTDLDARPGAELESARRRIQAGDPSPESRADLRTGLQTDESAAEHGRWSAASARERAAPRQLPAVTRGFIGRESQLAALDSLLDAHRGTGDSAAVAAVTGAAGIGKTTLAVHWAHRIADRFPDGQLFLNLRGFAPSAEPMSAIEALRAILGALGVEPERIPVGPEAQAALYRSLLADKRVLVVLDNARTAEQARLLLPGCPTCLVVITSRNRLTGLIATEGARPVSLDLFTETEARSLLADRLGTHRTAAEPRAVGEIVALGAGLPLALVVIAAHAAVRPSSGLAALAGQWSSKRQLDALAADDPTSGLRAVFSWSTRALSAAAARLFRLLGLHPGPHFALPAAASLAGLSEERTEPLLAELADACLLTEHGLGQYHIHSLLHAYAAEQAEDLAGDGEQNGALRRA